MTSYLENMYLITGNGRYEREDGEVGNSVSRPDRPQLRCFN